MEGWSFVRAEFGAPRAGLLVALFVLTTGCTPGPQGPAPPAGTGTLEAARTIAPVNTSAAPTATASQVPPVAPSPTPVPRKLAGRARLTATGAGVAGVQVRVSPMPINDGRVSGPDVTALTDESGAYTLTVMTWTSEALAASSSFQVMVQVTPPPGLVVLDVTNSLGGPPGTTGGMLTGRALFVGDLDQPIDITLGAGHIVQGLVTSGVTGSPLPGVPVNALGPNSMLIHGGAGDAFEIEASASTDATGRYRLTVRSGTFVIYASGSHDAGPRFWSDDPAVFQATPLRVERDISGLDIVVVPVARIDGQVRTGPPGTGGVAGTRVAAYAGGGSPCCRTAGVATTADGGTFLMYLPPGTYRIVFDPPAGSPYAAQWWRAAAGFATATDVTVASDEIHLEVELRRLGP
jgi:hypothetical protein